MNNIALKDVSISIYKAYGKIFYKQGIMFGRHHKDEDLTVWIENAIKSFVNNSPKNSLMNEKNEKAWEEPLVGFSNGNNSL